MKILKLLVYVLEFALVKKLCVNEAVKRGAQTGNGGRKHMSSEIKRNIIYSVDRQPGACRTAPTKIGAFFVSDRTSDSKTVAVS